MTLRLKSSNTLDVPSDAVTLRLTGPVKSFGGVPLKVWLAALKLSHAGSAAPLTSVAL